MKIKKLQILLLSVCASPAESARFLVMGTEVPRSLNSSMTPIPKETNTPMQLTFTKKSFMTQTARQSPTPEIKSELIEVA
jgi:hypothetical protein